MPIRHNREPQTRVPARQHPRTRGDRAAARRAWPHWTVLLALGGLALAALLAPAGQARGARERSPEEEAATVAATEAKQTEREERVAERKAQREAEKAAAREQREANRGARSQQSSSRRVQNGSRPRTHGDVQFSCTGATWTFTQFPAGTNTVQQVIRIYSEEGAPPITITGTFSFAGPTGETTTLFQAPPGIPPRAYKVDAWAKWSGNGLKGSFDVLGKLACSPAPAFSVEKLQKIAGGSGSYTPSPITGEVGDTVDYEILVKNTGNVPLSFGGEDVIDRNCGTLSGGPEAGTLAVGAAATYTCTHVLEAPGPYTNKAEVSGIPPAGDGPPVTHTSNSVVVEVPLPPTLPAPAFTIEKLQQIAGAGGAYTSSQLTALVGQTVDYEIIVTNTGNVPLSLEALNDPQCDAGTLAGETGGATLPAGAATTYTCTHLLDSADQSAGSYANTVTITGNPPGGEGSPITNSSNTVVVGVSPTASGSTLSSTSTAGAIGILSSTSRQSPSKTGVLAFSSATVPGLKGPQGCVRGDFRVSIKAANVASVTFYMDGHKLRTLTAKNAHKGLLTLLINPDKLKVGPHKLTAKITMTHTASTKAKQGTRTVRILRCGSAALTPKFTG
jgi:hypothetical protein